MSNVKALLNNFSVTGSRTKKRKQEVEVLPANEFDCFAVLLKKLSFWRKLLFGKDR